MTAMPKDFLPLAALARAAGWKVEQTAGAHWEWVPPDGGEILLTVASLGSGGDPQHRPGEGGHRRAVGGRGPLDGGRAGALAMTSTAELAIASFEHVAPGQVLSYVRTAGRQFSRVEFIALCCKAGRLLAPAILDIAAASDAIAPSVLPEVVPIAWSMANRPEGALGRDRWLELFGLAGYTEDGQPAKRPDSPLTLYRGAPERWRRGMAWTGDREQAERFASGDIHGRKGQVWVADVPPAALLAHNVILWRNEDEYVINPARFAIARAR